jgi:aryl-alcohol dehydrogenase-like predicted oxidoreductase
MAGHASRRSEFAHMIQQRNIRKSGLRVSAIGLGCNNFGRSLDLAASRPVIHKALDLGVTFFDCADVYGRHGGAETILAEVLGSRRNDIVLTTKFGRRMDDAGRLMGGSRRYIFTAVEASLRRLKTDRIDLYQYHLLDPLTPIEETVRALDDLVRAGKVRYVGCSHLPAWIVVDALWHARADHLTGFVACEDEYNLLARNVERELMPALRTHGLGLLPYYPLASGLLTGKYKRGEPFPAGSRFATVKDRDYAGDFISEANWTRLERLTAFAQLRGHRIIELAMSWLIANPLVACAIVGATTAEQVEENVRAAGWVLSPEDMEEIDNTARNPG